MTKLKHHGAISKSEIEFSFRKYGFIIKSYVKQNNIIVLIVEKNYSKDFNIMFNGLIRLKIFVDENMYDALSINTYPLFQEISNIIPKKSFYHIYRDGSLCYAPPQRPLVEKWKFEDFVKAADSLIYNYFSIEYIGKGELFELEHGQTGLEQYEFIYSRNLKNIKSKN